MPAHQFATMDDGSGIAFEFTENSGREALVFSPSLGTSMELFDAQMGELGSRYSVLRYDLRGHGRSDAPSGSYSFDRLGRDVLGLLDFLGVERAHFVGVSIGGMTGQWLGYRAPERLLSLTLANTSAYMGPPDGWSERIKAVIGNGMDAIVDSVIERWFTPQFRTTSPDVVGRIAKILRSTDPVGYAGCSAAIRDMDMRPILSLVRCPTLIIGGERDPATPLEHSQQLARGISGSAFLTLDAAHLSNVEQADAFNSTLANFLEEL